MGSTPGLDMYLLCEPICVSLCLYYNIEYIGGKLLQHTTASHKTKISLSKILPKRLVFTPVNYHLAFKTTMPV
jgi:hypothetical protein